MCKSHVSVMTDVGFALAVACWLMVVVPRVTPGLGVMFVVDVAREWSRICHLMTARSVYVAALDLVLLKPVKKYGLALAQK